MEKINWKKTAHLGWCTITIDLPAFMEYYKKISPEWYIKRGNTNEVKGRIDRFGQFIEHVNKDVVPAEFYLLVNPKTFKPKLMVVNGRHRMAWLLENHFTEATIMVPKTQQILFQSFICNNKDNNAQTDFFVRNPQYPGAENSPTD